MRRYLVLSGIVNGNLSVGGWIVGFTLLFAGVLATPVVRRRLESRFEVYPSSRTVLELYVALVGGGFAIATIL
ncbi:hypothetical protein [Natrinema salsiterrestre]|uniref:Uncharacterized protein n=1 Tax=Natrinema salsiterrestre TaxID=2950540 RepID=A0A9Q4L2R6_9EURY|nr:hypothetical protein [Natrinema salsiterrestre]MDF9744875.1 hypothetical protein [Natrinema salsiterrestre]